MGLIQAYRMALKSIKNNKIRSFLTMLGVIIGVASVIASVAFAQGSTKNVTDSIQSLGTNLLTINITGRGSNIKVTLEDLNKVAEQTNGEIAAIAPQVSGSITAKAGTKSRTTNIIGTSPDYETIKDTHVQSGRFILPIDIDYRQRAAVVGSAVVKDIFDGADPLGQDIKINGYVFKVIGVLQETAGGEDSSSDDQIIIPISTAQRITSTSEIRNFTVMVKDPDKVDEVINILTSYLTSKLKDSSVFSITSSKQMLSTLNSVTDSMMIILAGIATISLIVGGIGIMNIMFVSVTERTKEIGIRKALGAKRKMILIQFLIEALMITGIGGLLGITSGLGIIRFVVSSYVPAVYSMEWIILSFGISIFIGVVFGMFPAFKAAKLSPIDALRFE